MPRFYFHIHDSRDYLDTEGLELPDEVAAHVEAIRLAGAVLRDEAKHVAEAALWNMEVTDATGRPVCRVDLNFSVSRADVDSRGHLWDSPERRVFYRPPMDCQRMARLVVLAAAHRDHNPGNFTVLCGIHPKMKLIATVWLQAPRLACSGALPSVRARP